MSELYTKYATEQYVDDNLNIGLDTKADAEHNHDSSYDVKGSADAVLNSAKEYADTITNGLASREYVDAITDILATEEYVDSVIAGLATEEYVDEAVSSLDTIIAVDENRDGNVELRQFVDGTDEINSFPMPTAEDEGKLLRVVNGVPTWVSLASAEEASF